MTHIFGSRVGNFAPFVATCSCGWHGRTSHRTLRLPYREWLSHVHGVEDEILERRRELSGIAT